MNPVLDSDREESKLVRTDKNSSQVSVEYFHIYIDEKISKRQEVSLEYLNLYTKAWTFSYSKIILIDNYNPTKQLISADNIMIYLENKGNLPDYWAYEADLIDNAKELLKAIENPKLKRNYQSYIAHTKKFPCSLLTATWYITRLGMLDHVKTIKSVDDTAFVPSSRLINILPEDYASVEKRAKQIILKSSFKKEADKIQDIFYPTHSEPKFDLF